MEVKHFIFFAALLFGVPAAALLIRSSAQLQRAAMFLLIFSLPFSMIGINFFTDKFYRGTSRGFEVLGTDMIVLALLGAMIGVRETPLRIRVPGFVFYWLYFAMCVISMVNADSLLYSGYELMKMCMVFLCFITCYNYILRTRDVRTIFDAFACVLFLTMCLMLVQKYLWGIYQPNGPFPHRNSAAMFANLVAPVFLSITLNGKLSRPRFWFYFGAYGASALVVVMALSRGAILFFPVTTAVVALGSLLLKGFNTRRTQVLGLLTVLGLAAVLKAAPMVIDRFENAPEASGEGRIHLALTALNMAEDKTLGVGVNNWGIKVNPPYTYSEGTGMRRYGEDYQAGLVETIYLLVAAECGWIGFGALVLWLYYYYFKAFMLCFRLSDTDAFYLPLGIFGGLTAALGQSVLEWVLKQQANFYQLMVIFSIVAALETLRRNRRKPDTPTEVHA